MPKLRVLIVDDAVLVRTMVSEVLKSDPDIEIAGLAANGKIALNTIPICRPDVITLDVEMPEMGGIETLKRIKADHPDIPVIMFSALTEKGAVATMEALSLGASDYVTKPTSAGGPAQAKEKIRLELTSRIKALCKHRVMEPARRSPGAKEAPPAAAGARSTPLPLRISAITIGVSTGGPSALAQVLPKLPAGLEVPIFIVQHMPPVFTKVLADRLSAQSRLPVHEAAPGDQVKPGHIYLAPGGFHMEVVESDGRRVIVTHEGPMENSCRPAADVLFRSVVSIYGGETLAVILTGMGQDGTRGCELIRDAGGMVLAQDEATCVVWGMPGSVAQRGLADMILPLQDMAPTMTRLVHESLPRREAAAEC